MQSDRIDKEIIQILIKDGRIPLADLARKIGLSTTACRARKERLERDGLITGYSAVIGHQSETSRIVKYIIAKLQPNNQITLDNFARFLSVIVGIDMYSQLEGEYDYIIRASCMDQYSYEGIHNKINSHPHLVGIHTYSLIKAPF